MVGFACVVRPFCNVCTRHMRVTAHAIHNAGAAHDVLIVVELRLNPVSEQFLMSYAEATPVVAVSLRSRRTHNGNPRSRVSGTQGTPLVFE